MDVRQLVSIIISSILVSGQCVAQSATEICANENVVKALIKSLDINAKSGRKTDVDPSSIGGKDMENDNIECIYSVSVAVTRPCGQTGPGAVAGRATWAMQHGRGDRGDAPIV